MLLSNDHLRLAQFLSLNPNVSGTVLASHFGVSRTTISNWVAVLIDSGVEVETRPGLGYRLLSPVEFYDKKALLAETGAPDPAMSGQDDIFVSVHDAVSSTNDEALAISKRQNKSVICISDVQTGGRGRRGRVWLSPPALNVSLSVAWRCDTGVSALEGLSLAIGVALAEALANLGIHDIALKWPNDLYLAGGKLGGILIEIEGDFQGPCTVVVGVGLNRWLSDKLKANLDQTVTDLWTHRGEQTPSRHDLTIRLSRAICEVLRTFPQRGLASWRERWLARDALAGRAIRIEGRDQLIEGEAAGIDAKGALLVRTDQGLQAIYGGEVSVRSR